MHEGLQCFEAVSKVFEERGVVRAGHTSLGVWGVLEVTQSAAIYEMVKALYGGSGVVLDVCFCVHCVVSGDDLVPLVNGVRDDPL